MSILSRLFSSDKEARDTYIDLLGQQDRRHADEIKRMTESHSSEVAALNHHIAYLEQLQERLLQQMGLEPLSETRADSPSETAVTESPRSQPNSITGRMIARDKERTRKQRVDEMAEFTRWLEGQAQSDVPPPEK